MPVASEVIEHLPGVFKFTITVGDYRRTFYMYDRRKAVERRRDFELRKAIKDDSTTPDRRVG